MTLHVDVVVLGAGSAGLSAVGEVKKVTDNFVLVNAGHYGTLCARVACMPTKTLIEAANACHTRRLLASLGMTKAADLQVDRAAIMKHVRAMRDGFAGGMTKSTEKFGDKNIVGHGRFLDPTTIVVDGTVIKTRKTIISTGSYPVVPAPWKQLGERVITTDELFELTDLPSSMAVIGLGPAGLELAQAFARLDIRVTGVELSETIGGLRDPAINRSMVAVLKQEMDLHQGSRAELSDAGDKIEVSFVGGKVLVDKVLVSMGRRPNIENLGLEKLGVELDEHGLPPFDRQTMQIGDLPVFIAGDANNDLPLLHEAIDEGHIAGYNAVHEPVSCFKRRVPLAITFTEPNIVRVGQGLEELQGSHDIVIGEADFNSQSRAGMSNRNRGLLRVYADKKSCLLMGAEMAAPGGEHFGHLLALAIQQEMTIYDMLKLSFYHPVLEEGLRTALFAAAKQTGLQLSSTELLLCKSMPDRSVC